MNTPEPVDALRAVLADLSREAADPGGKHEVIGVSLTELEAALAAQYEAEDAEVPDAVDHGVIAQRRMLARERREIAGKIVELRAWLGAEYPSSPLAIGVDALVRGVERYLIDGAEFEFERELSEAPAVD